MGLYHRRASLVALVALAILTGAAAAHPEAVFPAPTEVSTVGGGGR